MAQVDNGEASRYSKVVRIITSCIMLKKSITSLGARSIRCSTLLPRSTFRASFHIPIAAPVYRGFASGPSSTDGHKIPKEVLELSSDAYHSASDLFLESLQEQLETLSDDHPQLIPDVELTQGVMTIVVPSVGTYVVNKQPPNKQIWLSSPVSGPNRFDLYHGRWVSLRDGQDLLKVLNSELTKVLPEPVILDA